MRLLFRACAWKVDGGIGVKCATEEDVEMNV